MNSKIKKYVVFFDLDYTILDISTAGYFAKYLYHKKIISMNVFLKGIIREFINKIGFFSSEKIIYKWAMRYRGTLEKKAIYFLQLCFDNVVVNHFRKNIIEEINIHKKNMGQIVILSASPAYVCEPIKEYLKLDDIICTELEVENGFFTGKLLGKYCFGKEKLNRAKEYCRKYNFKMEEAFYYADSFSDISVFKNVGFPVCVSPDRRLKRVAEKMGWKIIDE